MPELNIGMAVCVLMSTFRLFFYLVVVSCSRLLVSGPQGLELGVQDVQQLLNQSHGRADISGLDPTPRVVHQLSGYVGSILATLYLRTNTHTDTRMFTYSDGIRLMTQICFDSLLIC